MTQSRPHALARSVYTAWNNYGTGALTAVYERWVLNLDLIILFYGDNAEIENFRGDHWQIPTVLGKPTIDVD